MRTDPLSSYILFPLEKAMRIWFLKENITSIMLLFICPTNIHRLQEEENEGQSVFHQNTKANDAF